MTAPARRPRAPRRPALPPPGKTLSAADLLMWQAKQMKEVPTLTEHVRRACKARGLELAYHTHTAKFSVAGFPDYVILAPSMGILWRELKQQATKPSEHQQKWLDGLATLGFDVGIWRPLDWLDGTIDRELDELLHGMRGQCSW